MDDNLKSCHSRSCVDDYSVKGMSDNGSWIIEEEDDGPDHYFDKSLDFQMCSESSAVTEPVASLEREGTQNITQFMSDVDSEVVMTPSAYDLTRNDALNPEADLGAFLNRPVQLTRLEWQKGSTLEANIRPWFEYLTHPTIVKKLQNYSWISGKLHIKVQINGGPFYFGKAIAGYRPYTDKQSLSIVSSIDRLTGLMKLSQRDHIIIDPTESKGGEIVAPFVYPKPYLSLDDLDESELRQMGIFQIVSFDALQNTTIETTSKVINLTVFAWMEDVKLSGPTYLRSESGKADEYGEGVISKPASAIARAAGYFKSIPGLAPYATATQIAATGVSNVAQIFGFSRPVSLEPIHKYRMAPMGNMANSSIDEATDKLSFDPKQELTVNSDVVGISRDDELHIKDIAMKESLFNIFPWGDYSGEGQKLFSCNVTPIVYGTQDTQDPDFNQIAIQTTPLMHAAVPFKYWRGGITYRFEVMCSAFHRGRLKLQYVPNKETSNLEGDMASVYTRIIDISESKVFEVTVNWNQNISYKEVSQITSALPPQTCAPVTRGTPLIPGTSTPYLPDNCNGQLAIYVQNELTSPDAKNDRLIYVNCYVRGAEDIEFAEPVEGFGQLSMFPTVLISESASSWPVMQDTADGSNTCVLEPIGVSKRLDELNLVHFGETFCTFRDMLKRYNYNRTYGDIKFNRVAGKFQLDFTLPNFPVYRGADLDGGLDTVSTPVGTKNYTYARTTLLNWLTPAFVARRGGLRWKYIVTEGDSSKLSDITVERNQSNTNAFITTVRRNLADSVVADSYLRAGPKASQGMYATHYSSIPTAEVELPFYTNLRFVDAGKIKSDEITESHTLRVNGSVSDTQSMATVSAYVATGEDFNLSWYLNSPEVYFQADAAG